MSTTKNGATYPPINKSGTGQEILTHPGQILSLLPVFVVVGGFVSPIFHYMWTNGEAQTNKQSIYLPRCLWLETRVKEVLWNSSSQIKASTSHNVSINIDKLSIVPSRE